MAYIEIDRNLCQKDGLCAAVCPMGIILGKPKEFPQKVSGGDDICIDCGHCVAVCPTGAITQRTMSPDNCPPLESQSIWDEDQAEEFLRKRRSIRAYKNQPVEREKLEKLIDIARYAPSGHNTQPARWLVIRDADEIHAIGGLVCDWMRYMLENKPELARSLLMDKIIELWDQGVDRILRGAPHLIVAHAHKDERTAPAACTIALSYLELFAPSLGLGSCWAGFFNTAANLWQPLKDYLDLPEGHVSQGAQMVGYPKIQYQRLPLRKEPVITWR
jgi:nitroreductase/NAD-dependent dihydropyrimidine dehydrogenase PreA subunit